MKSFGASLDTVLTSKGITSKNVAHKFSFNNSSTSANDIFSNDDINTVFIATPHNSHADYVIQSLEADIEGNLVAEAQSNVNLRYKNYNLEIDGGTAYWNGKNLANNTVASGVYLVLFSDFDTLETKVSKIMIIR